MEYRRLGKSGLKLSALSFGSWVTFKNQVDSALAERLFGVARDAGVNYFDSSEAYAHGEAELIFGRVLKKLTWPRDSYCVSSKVFFGCRPDPAPTQRGLSRKHVFEACHQALARLQVEYLDLYFCHRPDPQTPVAETVWAMHQLVQQGKVLYWGTSEWSAEAIDAAHQFARAEHLVPPSMEQPQYNLFCRARVEQEYAALYRDYGMGTTIWSPLASGVLSGKYAQGIPTGSRLALAGYTWLRDQYQNPEGRERIRAASRLAALARELGMSCAQLAIAWCLKNPQVSTVILGASKLEQLQENLAALAELPKLTPAAMTRIETAVSG
ncbi:MAG: potassium channel beta subunit family protein [Gammaproteobacteria bacterium]